MRQSRITLYAACALVFAGLAGRSGAQESFFRDFHAHNTQMAALQPVWVTPLVQSDPRLGQGLRISVGNLKWPGGQTISYGNNHGLGLVFFKRIQFDLNPPAFFRNHSTLVKDGFGNLSTQVKYRIASAGPEHGNYVVTAILGRSFTPRAAQNGALTGSWYPKLAAGKLWGRVAAMSMVSGELPTGKVAAQGRAINWSVTGEARATQHLWFILEDNATFIHGGPDDGKKQNFLTPELSYHIRSKAWQPAHTSYMLLCGLQTATTGYHEYNHNLITEARVVF